MEVRIFMKHNRSIINQIVKVTKQILLIDHLEVEVRLIEEGEGVANLIIMKDNVKFIMATEFLLRITTLTKEFKSNCNSK